jgi:NAD(P)-dependent dehydrogenase (short-subunit alcohol dehydrogenase family)
LRIPRITLEGKSVLITGAGNGMGQAYAVACAAHGASVACLDREALEDTARIVKEQTGSDVLCLKADMLNLDEVRQAIDQTVDALGKLDVLVNNAGVVLITPLDETTPEDFDLLVGVNLKGVFFACQHAARHMVSRKQGVIINIGSELSFTGAASYSAYAATKGGIYILSQSLAIELGPHNVRVVTLAPGPTNTRVHTENLKDPDTRHALENKGVLGRMNEPEDTAGALVLLASDAASMVTGTAWSVDGGSLAR